MAGAGPAEELARALGLSRVRVYQHLQFLRFYPSRENVEALGQRGLKWAMVVALLGISSDDERTRLQEEAISQCWSVDRLRLEIRKFRRSEGGGWPHDRERGLADVLGDLARLDDATAAWLVAYEVMDARGVEHCLRGKIGGAQDREQREAMRTRLRSIVHALEELERHARDLGIRLRALPAAWRT